MVSNSVSPAFITILTPGAGNNPSNATRVASFTVNFPEAGLYQLYARLRVAEEKERKENVYLKRREQNRREGAIIGEAPTMKRLFDQLKKVVNTRVTVLVEGETGTGKELIASAVHYWSDRRERLFVAQNCAAMPENLLESELFGHKKGAFTGAEQNKKGLFEIADGGTLFLDEVTEMPMALQSKLPCWAYSARRSSASGRCRCCSSATTISERAVHSKRSSIP